jgi:hypothetical protein
MLIGIRGSSGSGKSHIGHRLVAEYKLPGPEGDIYWPPNVPPIGLKTKPKLIGHRLRNGLVVLGAYKPGVACGGLEAVAGRIDVEFDLLLRAARRFDHVFFESLTISRGSPRHTVDFARSVEVEGLHSRPLVLPTLDTPADLCRDRIYQRRAASGKRFTRPLNEVKTVYEAHRTCHRSRERLLAAGLDTPLLDHERGVEAVVEMFRSGGWSA